MTVNVDAANLSPQHVLAKVFEEHPELGSALDTIRGPCMRFQNKVPFFGRRCKNKNCPFLHVDPGQEFVLAKNRLQHPFLQMTGDGKLLLIPPFKEAVKFWWSQTLGETTPCPITSVDVLREGESQLVEMTLNKAPPSAIAQKSVKQCSIRTEDGCIINYSSAKIPDDRTWWHRTDITAFGDILRKSLQTGPAGTWKAVYSFKDLEDCNVYGGGVAFAFRSCGMVTKLTKGCSTPIVIPEGVIGFLDSNNKRQWLHHPNNVQLILARVEYNTFCTCTFRTRLATHQIYIRLCQKLLA